MTIDLYSSILCPYCRLVESVAAHYKIPLNIKPIDLSKGETRTPEYLKINPNHTVPTMIDGDLVLTESRAIITYLIDKYAAGASIYPQDPIARAKINNILFYDASTLSPAGRAIIHAKHYQNKDPSSEALSNFKEKIQVLEQLLGDRKFFGGDQISVADILLGVLFLSFDRMEEIKTFISTNLKQYWQRIYDAFPEVKQLNDEAAKRF